MQTESVKTTTKTKPVMSKTSKTVKTAKKAKTPRAVASVTGKFDAELHPTKIRLARVTAHMTQQEAARRLDVSLPTWGAIERGFRDLRKSLAVEVAEILGKSLNDLFMPVPGSTTKVVAK